MREEELRMTASAERQLGDRVEPHTGPDEVTLCRIGEIEPRAIHYGSVVTTRSKALNDLRPDLVTACADAGAKRRARCLGSRASELADSLQSVEEDPGNKSPPAAMNDRDRSREREHDGYAVRDKHERRHLSV